MSLPDPGDAARRAHHRPGRGARRAGGLQRAAARAGRAERDDADRDHRAGDDRRRCCGFLGIDEAVSLAGRRRASQSRRTSSRAAARKTSSAPCSTCASRCRARRARAFLAADVPARLVIDHPNYRAQTARRRARARLAERRSASGAHETAARNTPAARPSTTPWRPRTIIRPPTQVFQRVRRVLPRVSLGTVYRNLDKLREQGRVRVVRLEGGRRATTPWSIRTITSSASAAAASSTCRADRARRSTCGRCARPATASTGTRPRCTASVGTAPPATSAARHRRAPRTGRAAAARLMDLPALVPLFPLPERRAVPRRAAAAAHLRAALSRDGARRRAQRATA